MKVINLGQKYASPHGRVKNDDRSTYVVDHSPQRQSMRRSTVDLLVLTLICHIDNIPAESWHGEQASECFGLHIGKPCQPSFTQQEKHHLFITPAQHLITAIAAKKAGEPSSGQCYGSHNMSISLEQKC